MLWPAVIVLAAGSEAIGAHAALEAACGRCHRGGEASEGGFDFLFDREALVRERFVVPGNARASRLVERLRKGEMPPPEAGLKGRRQALAALEAWIAAGAPAAGFDVPKPRAPQSLLTAAQVARLVRDDEVGRYFIVRPGEEAALAKALNSLSWRPRLQLPEPVVPGLVRIDLDGLGWTRDDWDRTLIDAYPFAIDAETRVLRADWFIASATRPPLYHALARTPETEGALESLLDVRLKDDVLRGAVARVGFASSGVSQNNRLLERHATRFGPYWRSFDFASNVGSRNLFERPLAFVHDGGEHIFSLPNGLFGYLLTDARGQRIDRGPTSIVRDPRRPDGAVENGLSCMGCHARGLIPKADQLRAAVRASTAGFDARERRRVALRHPDAESVQGLFQLDAKRFVGALEALGVDAAEEEPITRVALAYERDLDLAAAAGELGVSTGALTRALERGPEAMAPLKLKGTVKRDAFVAAFPVLVQRLNLGRVRRVAGRGAWAKAEARAECGLDSGTVEARAEACAIVFPQKARVGPFRLVAHAANGHEVWLDERRSLLWSETKSAASQADAASRCSQDALVEALWFLPGAAELEGALADGLPGAGWQLLWSRDVDNGYKHGTPGVAVSADGRREETQTSALPSRCAARI